ncbi:hypothetical protein L207DRAFT_159564 [Hyaloscypha variabilis F]|uniref:HTH La-type RNA-binding domain-containing protein n=1 Tax=Hyaloscypha variabilis (strain UAMH 11265 / GT02V1 / F) TaxID=1149755 RepID=A0A2J6S9T1_HYAVF|nr:hypothetical protein L207DRAFT_159564 [Hyaloscypha variabilis F]
MSNLEAEITEPEPGPAATSLSNDETAKKEAPEPTAPTDKGVVPANAESEDVKDAAEVKDEQKTEKSEATTGIEEEKSDKKTERNGSSGEKKERFDDNGVLKTSAKIYESDVRKNYSKYDPAVLPTTDDPSKIRAQVEFYFSDANLPTDSHLWKLTDGESNLPVSIKEICAFGRMKRFQPVSAVVAALRESKFLEISGPEGQETVNRKDGYSAHAVRPSVDPRSVYVKGFGDEEPSSQFDIEAFFAQFGPTNAVRLRRTPEKLFKGSVFVEFADEETARNFLALDPKPLWKDKYPLKIQSKKDYTEEKLQDIKDGKIEPAESWGPRGRGGGYRGNNNRGGRGHYKNDSGGRGRGDSRGDRDPDDWKKRREEDRANGFKDNHHKRDRGHQRDGDRKGRGRGRGRDDGGRRNNDRNREREDRDEKNEKKRPREGDDEEKSAKKVDSKSNESPAVKTEDSPSTNGKKRAREDDNADQTPATKVDSKSDEAPANGKKRSREDDEATEPSAKKVDTKSEVTVDAS